METFQNAQKVEPQQKSGEELCRTCKHCAESFNHEQRRVSPSQQGEHEGIRCAEMPQYCRNLRKHLCVRNGGERQFKCETCGERFTEEACLNLHVRAVDTEERLCISGTRGKGFPTKRQPMSNARQVDIGENTYKCETCGKRFADRSNLNSHVRLHTGEKPHRCGTCGKGFVLRASLNRHSLVHTGERPHKCETCGKRFSTKKELKVHVRIHSGERSYTCETCGKSFTNENNLTAHVRVHTGETPYTCQTSGKSYAQKGHLNVHVRVHTGERPYTCETCGKSFTNKYSLTAHVRVHKRFTQKSNLNSHAKVHIGEKPHRCETCSEAFPSEQLLTMHLRVHTGEKLFKCDRGFTLRSNVGAPHLLHALERHAKGFTQNTELQQHAVQRKRECVHECWVCLELFSDENAMIEHVRSHVTWGVVTLFQLIFIWKTYYIRPIPV